MTTIWKFVLPIVDEPKVMIPGGANYLTVQMQHGELCLWAMVDPDAKLVEAKFRIIGTGNPAEGVARFDYLGTVQNLGGGLIWHVFAVFEKTNV